MLTRPLQHLVVAILFRPSAGLLASRAVVRARPLQHLEVAALRRVRARPFVPEETGRSQRLQLLELSAPRYCGTNECPLNAHQKTSQVPVFQQARVSEVRGTAI